MRYPDLKCYSMIHSKRAGHKFFLNKKGELPLRCGILSCKAKALLIPREPEKLEDIEKYWMEIITEDF